MAKTLEQRYRYHLVDDVPYFESRYYAQKFINEQLPVESDRFYSVERVVGYRNDQYFKVMVIGPVKIKQNKDFV